MAYTRPLTLTERLFVVVSPELKERFNKAVPAGERSEVLRRLVERETARRERRAASSREQRPAEAA